jgi:oligosaccharide repeat unit polymerase
VLFSVTWLVTYVLATLDLAQIAPIDFTQKAAAFFFVIVGSFFGTYLLFNMAANQGSRSSQKKIHNARYIVFSKCRLIFAIWLFISIIEIAIDGGVPLFWILRGYDKSYAEFGIGTVHGLANALWLYLAFSTVSSSIFRDRCTTKSGSGRDLPRLAKLLVVCWPFLMVSRGLLTIIFLQLLVFYIIYSELKLRTIIRNFIVIMFLFFVVFGFIGDSRSEEFSIYSTIGIEKQSSLFSYFVWPYLYLTTPTYNLVLNIQEQNISGNLFPIYSTWSLLPSQVRNLVGIPVGFDAYLGDLAHGAFNVGTAYLSTFFDWGWGGIVTFTCFVSFVSFTTWHSYRKTGNPAIYSLAATCLILTIFTNQYFSLPIILYFVLLKFNSSTNTSHMMVQPKADCHRLI